MGRFGQTLKGTLGGSRVGGPSLGVLVLVLALLASLYRGVPIADVELHDGGVWVTNARMRLLGHLNYPSKALDGGVAVTAEAFDVHQAGNKVALRDFTASTTSLIDTAAFLLGASSSFPTDLDVSFAGDTVAVSDQQDGKVWSLDIEAVGSYSRDADPLIESPGARAVASASGDVAVVGADGQIQMLERVGDAFGEPRKAGKLSDYPSDTAGLIYTMVGDEVVVLDPSTNVSHTTGETVQLPGTEAFELQPAGPENDVVVLASPSELFYVSLDDGEIATTQSVATGEPVQPLFFQGCVYAAWMGSGVYLRDCPSTEDDVSVTVDSIASSESMAFRTNRDVIVLNDMFTGLVILVNDDMIEVDDWTQVQASMEADDQQSEEESTTELGVAANPENNTPPVAQPDSFGVRPGRAVWLPVLANDQDPDGDILTATVLSQPGLGPVAQVAKGESLQITVPDDASGADTFSYQAEDGRGGSSEARVTVTVRDWDVNEAPKPLRKPKLTISQGSSVSYNVLNDWYDPDGDMVYLESAGPADDTAVEFRPDGTVTIRDLGTADPGTRPIPVTMTDGQELATYEIQLEVVQGNRNHPPIANSDHVTAVPGQTVTVQPLANDSDPNGDRLRLVNVEPLGGLSVTTDFASGSVTLSAEAAGSYYVTYAVSDNKAETSGLIRFDVNDPGTEGQPPAAVPDIALLPNDGSTLVDLTVNDSDPMGGVLVVQSLQVDPGSSLSVQLIDHHLARVSAPSGLETSTSFSYTVSNGFGEASAEVLVVPLPAQSTDQPPVAVDDATIVRAGDVTTVDVLLNDISPAHLALSVNPTLSVLAENEGGIAFVADNKVRFRAGPDSGTVRVTYTVRDTIGGFSSATVVFTVIAADDQNDPPNPMTLSARTFSGTPVRIQVPTSGTDPDGDSVTLGGVDAPAPTMGSVTLGEGYFEYTPSATASGTDVFGYTVTDQFGAVGRSVVRVGISPLPKVNQTPFATPDTVSARPERLLAIPVTVNDIDPDGDQVQLIDGSVKPVDETTTTPVTVRDNRVELSTPAEPGILRYYYDVSDGRGGVGRGLLTIEVSPESSLLFPIARDDTVTLAQIIDQQSVTVDVLVNDEDPDGASAELKLTSGDPGVTVSPERTLVIAVTERRQMVVYSVTDPDGQSANAVVTVPGTLEQRPTLTTDNVPVTVPAGELLELKLADYVRVRTGQTPRLTFADLVKVTSGGDGSAPVKDETTLVFRSTPDFVGPTSIQFEVTDGTSPEDLTGLKATLAIPIIVEPNPNANKPPEIHPSQVNVAAGENAIRVDLGAMINDPDDRENAKIKVSLGEVSDPFKVSIEGLTLVVSAPVDAAPGTPGGAAIEVTDGGGEKVGSSVPLQVVSSTRPLLAVAPIAINNANAGEPSTVELTSYVTNPFAAEGKPFTLVGQPAVALGSGTATASGQSITVTPATGFSGQMSVTFRLADATNDPARQVSGTIAVTVRDKPGAPVNVVAASNASRTADVTWSSGPANGAQITAFDVRWSGADGSSGSTQVGQVTSTTVTNLTNNVWYTFTVTATNEVGVSEASAPSNQVRPDTKPDRVGTPTGKFGDRQIDVTWPAGTTEGAPIDRYEVSISPAPGGVSTQEVRGTSMTWTGLANGTPYSLTVVAVSVNNLASDPSDASAPQTPAGVPGRPAAPSVVKAPASALPPSANVSWPATDGNGDPAGLLYELRQTSTGQVLCSGAATSCGVTLGVSGTNQTFEVRATNKSQLWSDWSPVSNAIRPFQPPSPVSGLTVTPTGQNNSVTINFAPGALNGAQPGEVTYYWQANGASGPVSPGQTITSGAFPNGQNVSVSVYPVSRVNGEQSQGDASGSVSVNAYGPPKAPSVWTRGNVNDVTVGWNASASGNGRSIVEVETNTGAGKPVVGEQNVGSGRNQTHCISARAKDETGLWGAWSGQSCASTWGNPTFRFDVTSTGVTGEPGWYLREPDAERLESGSSVYC